MLLSFNAIKDLKIDLNGDPRLKWHLMLLAFNAIRKKGGISIDLIDDLHLKMASYAPNKTLEIALIFD